MGWEAETEGVAPLYQTAWDIYRAARHSISD